MEIIARYVPKGDKILDAGCGTGVMTEALASSRYDVTGTDISCSAVELAQHRCRNLPRCSLSVCDIKIKQFAQPFDAVYDRGLFHNIGNEDARDGFSAKIASLLVDAGTWIDVSGSPDGSPIELNFGKVYLSHLVPPIERYFEILEVRRIPFGVSVDNVETQAWLIVSRRRS